MTVRVKICGLREPAHAAVAVESGAAYLGFVFYPQSPRNITPAEAFAISAPFRAKAGIVAVCVDPDDALIDALQSQFRPDFYQLHGTESAARVHAIRERISPNQGIIKGIAIRSKEDIQLARSFEPITEMRLLDAKPPTKGLDSLPGGNGIQFDWTLLNDETLKKPWFLSGGLNIHNLEEAIKTTSAPLLDVSSGVESSPGVKDEQKIREFLQAVEQCNLC